MQSELQIRVTELVKLWPSCSCEVVGCDLTCIQLGGCHKVVGVGFVAKVFQRSLQMPLRGLNPSVIASLFDVVEAKIYERFSQWEMDFLSRIESQVDNLVKESVLELFKAYWSWDM